MCVDEKRCSERMNEMNDDVIELKTRMSKLEDSHHQLKINFTKMEGQINLIDTNTVDIKADVKKILDKPAQYWDKIVMALIGGVVGYIINLFIG